MDRRFRPPSFSPLPTTSPLAAIRRHGLGLVAAATLGAGALPACEDDERDPVDATTTSDTNTSDTGDIIAPQPPPRDTDEGMPDVIPPQPPPEDTDDGLFDISPQPPPQDTDEGDADEGDFIPPQPPPQDTDEGDADEGEVGEDKPDAIPPQPPPQPPPREDR